MTANLSERLYPKFPVLLQNAACSFYGWRESRTRFGKEFHARLGWLLESEKWSAGEIANYQDEQLRKLVRHAYDTVPFYRERMSKRKLTPQDFRSRADLSKLPILTKEDVRQNYSQLISSAARSEETVARHTSGTTGKSLDFLTSKRGMAFQWAVWWRHRARFGMELDAWHVNFTGKMAVPPEQSRPPYWRWNWPMHQGLVNMHHLTPAKIPAIIEFLNDHDFQYYSGYPSVLHAAAYAALEAGLKLPRPPKFIVTGAENMLDFQRRDLASFTGATLTDQYGFSEGCGNASQCTEFVYHEDFEFGIMEAVDQHTTADGVEATIVCTGFANPEFPFLRYEVGDTGLWSEPSFQCPCGRQSAVLTRILGRVDDFVVTPEGNRIMRFDYCFKGTVNIQECQVVQDRLGEIRLRIVRRPAYSGRDEELVAQEVHHWISPKLDLRFEYVDEIERERSGKFRAVKSNLASTENALPKTTANRP